MRYNAYQLKLMAQIVVDAETNSKWKYMQFMQKMSARTGIPIPYLLERIKGYL